MWVITQIPVKTKTFYLFVATTLRGTELCGLLVTAGHGGVLGHCLLGQRALLLGPLLAVLLGLVAHGLLLALDLVHRLAAHHVVLNLHTQQVSRVSPLSQLLELEIRINYKLSGTPSKNLKCC